MRPQDLTPLLTPLTALQRFLAHFDDRGIVWDDIAPWLQLPDE